MKNRCAILILLTGLLYSCSSEAPEWPELDLLSQGMPIVIKAPPDVEIKKMDLIFQRDLSLKSGDDYYVQIFEADATTFNLGDLKIRAKEEVEASKYFESILEEDDAGFIFKTRLDSSLVDYDFRYVKIQGDKEYTFQTGLIGVFDLEQVRRMYNSVQ